MFPSSPGETSGRSKFPYCRVDSQLRASKNWISVLKKFGAKDQEDFKKIYEAAAIAAFKAVVWIEFGFQDLDNLAVSPASKNWTGGVGHFVNDQQRAVRNKDSRQKMYEEALSKFVQFRDANKVEDDIFDKYKAGDLLDKFRSS